MIFDTNLLFLLFSLIILLATIVYVVKLTDQKKDNLKAHPLFSNLFYLDGHPQLESSGTVLLYLDQHNLILESKESSERVSIPRNMILDLLIIDKSTIIKNDPTNLKLYLGSWGYLASKLPMKKNIYLLVIKWHNDKYIYNTTFEFTGYQSARNASIAYKILSDALNL